MMRRVLLGAAMVVAGLAVGLQLARAEEPAVPPPAFEMKFDTPKTWTVSTAKRNGIDVTVYVMDKVKDSVFVVYPPSSAYGATIKGAVDVFMTKHLGTRPISRYPKRLRVRSTWYGIKHAKQHAMIKGKRAYAMRVVYAFAVKGYIQIAVGESASSRMVKKLTTTLSPVTMGGSLKKYTPGKSAPPATQPSTQPPKPPATQPNK